MKKTGLLVSLLLASNVIADNAAAAPVDKSHAYGIAIFGFPGCGSVSQTHAAHTKSANAFRDVFTNLQAWGLWGSSTSVNDQGASSAVFTDAARSAQCACSVQADTSSTGIDSAPVAYIHTHGSHTTAGKGASQIVTGSALNGSTCGAATDTNFLFGNAGGVGKLEIAVVKACQGADLNVFRNGGYRAMVASSSRFQVYNGFHGDSSCGNFVASYVTDYAEDSLVDGVGENWIDEAYDWGITADDCPSSIVYGNSKAARTQMFAHGGFVDRQLVNASKSGSSYFFVSGCTPVVGTGVAMPNP